MRYFAIDRKHTGKTDVTIVVDFSKPSRRYYNVSSYSVTRLANLVHSIGQSTVVTIDDYHTRISSFTHN